MSGFFTIEGEYLGYEQKFYGEEGKSFYILILNTKTKRGEVKMEVPTFFPEVKEAAESTLVGSKVQLSGSLSGQHRGQYFNLQASVGSFVVVSSQSKQEADPPPEQTDDDLPF
jgi:hypothetical protein